MKKFIFCSPSTIPQQRHPDAEYYSMYERSLMAAEDVSDMGLSLKKDVGRAGISPPTPVWDFVSIALAVAAADQSCSRAKTFDGWTRQMSLDICLCEPLVWQSQKLNLEATFRFLTGDIWDLNFFAGGEPPPKARKPQTYKADCVSLLSGGVDSLIGAIDLTKDGKVPLFVSKIVAGDKTLQKEIAKGLGAEARHLQWSFNCRPANEREGSTRGRSIIFFAYALLAASALPEFGKTRVSIFVPENGFISLNVPLSVGRVGSLSTKTTHPIYMSGLQNSWNSVGIDVDLRMPFDYQFKTKGELVLECRDQRILKRFLGDSTSCGRYQRKKTHCGSCVPCLVRRGAFLRAGIKDPTVPSTQTGERYLMADLSSVYKRGAPNDVGTAAIAVLRLKSAGIESLLGGALSFAAADDRIKYKGVVERGIVEIGTILSNYGVV